MTTMTTMTTATAFRPAHVLGCSEPEAEMLLAGKRVTPGEVEATAMSVYAWRRHMRDPRSYWLTATQAAGVLHLSTTVVRRMLDEERLPHATHSSGVRLMRRHDIEDLALARMR